MQKDYGCGVVNDGKGSMSSARYVVDRFTKSAKGELERFHAHVLHPHRRESVLGEELLKANLI